MGIVAREPQLLFAALVCHLLQMLITLLAWLIDHQLLQIESFVLVQSISAALDHLGKHFLVVPNRGGVGEELI